MATIRKTHTLIGCRAVGIMIDGTLHHDAATTFSSPTWSTMSEEEAEEDIMETARLCGCNPSQHFSIVRVDLDLPTWWDQLDGDEQDRILDIVADTLDPYYPGWTTIAEYTGDESAEDCDA